MRYSLKESVFICDIGDPIKHIALTCWIYLIFQINLMKQ